MYGGDLRYMDVGHRLAENLLPVRCCIILEKNYGFDFVSDRHCWDVALNFEFPIVSVKLNYVDIISVLNKLKFHHINISQTLWFYSRKWFVLVRPAPSFFSSHSLECWIFLLFGNTTRLNKHLLWRPLYYMVNVFIYKNQGSIFKHNVKVGSNIPKTVTSNLTFFSHEFVKKQNKFLWWLWN